jgi:predicted phage tail protein
MTKSGCTATGLNPGQMYYFRVRAVGTSGLSPWSDIAQKRAS